MTVLLEYIRVYVYRSFGINFPYFYKYLAKHFLLCLMLVATYYASIIGGSLDWQHREIITIFAIMTFNADA